MTKICSYVAKSKTIQKIVCSTYLVNIAILPSEENCKMVKRKSREIEEDKEIRNKTEQEKIKNKAKKKKCLFRGMSVLLLVYTEGRQFRSVLIDPNKLAVEL